MIHHVRQFGAAPLAREVIYPEPNPKVQSTLLAIGTLFGGLGAALGIVLVAQGRAKDAYPFAIAATVTTAVLGAIKVLGEDL